MTPLRIVRRFHAPLVCLAIACLFSAGCRSNQEVLSLGEPSEAYQADNGSVLYGYYVQPTTQPDYAGWHWLVVEPSTSELLLKKAASASEQTVNVTHKGWGRNAELIPPLVEPGLADRTPPTVGEGGLTELRFIWDSELRGPRLVDSSLVMLPLMRVSPQSATLKTWERDREAMMDVLKIVAIGALVAGLILLGGSAEFDLN